MIRLRNRRRPGQAEGTVVGDGRYRAADVADATFAGVVHRLIDRSRELGEVELIDVTDDRRQYAIIDLDRDAEVHRGRARDAAADDPMHHAIVIFECECQRAQAVDRCAGTAFDHAAMGQQRINAHGTCDGGERTAPRTQHARRDGLSHRAHRAAFAEVALDVFGGDATAFAGAVDRGEVGR